MATSNFTRESASTIFAISIETEFDWDDYKDNINYELEQLGYDEANRPEDGVFWSKTIYKMFGDTEVGFTVVAVLRSGYYGDANLDWFLLDYEGYKTDDPTLDLYYNFERQSIMPKGMWTVQSGHAKNWMTKAVADETEKLEKCYRENIGTTELKVRGRFSNGETLYEEVN